MVHIGFAVCVWLFDGEGCYEMISIGTVMAEGNHGGDKAKAHAKGAEERRAEMF